MGRIKFDEVLAIKLLISDNDTKVVVGVEDKGVNELEDLG